MVAACSSSLASHKFAAVCFYHCNHARRWRSAHNHCHRPSWWQSVPHFFAITTVGGCLLLIIAITSVGGCLFLTTAITQMAGCLLLIIAIATVNLHGTRAPAAPQGWLGQLQRSSMEIEHQRLASHSDRKRLWRNLCRRPGCFAWTLHHKVDPRRMIPSRFVDRLSPMSQHCLQATVVTLGQSCRAPTSPWSQHLCF